MPLSSVAGTLRKVKAGGVLNPRRQPVTFSLREQFITAGSISSNRNAQPGPGSFPTVTDSGSKLIISGGKLCFDKTTTQAWGDPCIIGASHTRVAGRALLSRVTPLSTTVNAMVGWITSGTSNNGQASAGLTFTATPTIGLRFGGGTLIEFGAYNSYLPYETCEVLRTNGSFFMVRGGIYTRWTLLYVDNFETTSPVYPAFSNKGQWGTVDYLAVKDFDGAWASDYGIAQYRKATTVASDTASATNGNFIVEHTITASTGVTQELMFRRIDDNNCWILRCDQTNSQALLIEKNNGVETTRDTKSVTFTNGSTYRLQVACDGTSIFTYIQFAAQCTYLSATYNQTQTGVKVSRAGTNLVIWPRNPELPYYADLTKPNRILAIGDSKTDGTGDNTTPALGANGYLPLLVNALGPASWVELQRLAIGGTTVASWQARIDSDIALIQTSPTHILINLGANDIAPAAIGPVAVTWQANLGYILDALHTRWPGAKIYVTRVWRSSNNGNMTTLNDTWIPAVLATRSSFAFAGIDERNILPGSDSGATNTTDGVHPNRTGYTLVANAWKTIMGYS